MGNHASAPPMLQPSCSHREGDHKENQDAQCNTKSTKSTKSRGETEVGDQVRSRGCRRTCHFSIITNVEEKMKTKTMEKPACLREPPSGLTSAGRSCFKHRKLPMTTENCEPSGNEMARENAQTLVLNFREDAQYNRQKRKQ